MTADVRRWTEFASRRTWNPEQARCIDVLCAIARPYNLPLIGAGWHHLRDHPNDSDERRLDDVPVLAPVVVGANYIFARLRHTELGTFDGSELTRLVIAGHRRAVRVAVSAEAHMVTYDPEGDEFEYDDYVSAVLEVRLHARKPPRPGMSLWERHPTLEQAMGIGES